MKFKKIIALTVLGVLSIGGSVVFAASNKTNASTNTVAVEQTNVKITKEKASEIMKASLQKYFNTTIDGKNLSQDIRPAYGDGNKVAEWIIYWRDTELSDTWELKDTSILYGGSIDAETGEITSISVNNGDRYKAAQEMSVKEIKNLSIDFIKKYSLVDKIDNLKLLGEYSLSQYDKQKDYVFSYGDKNTDVIYVTVDLVNKTVSGFCGGTIDTENTKSVTE